MYCKTTPYMYKIRVISDVKEDVIRTVLVDNNIQLENLHRTITEAFGFDGSEMASFYRSDEEWNQGEEIPLVNMSDNFETLEMCECSLENALPDEHAKLIYVYDFLKMWTFYVEVVDILSESQDDLPKTILSVGELPKEAPDKTFTAEKSDETNEDMFDDGLDYFDDFDFNDY